MTETESKVQRLEGISVDKVHLPHVYADFRWFINYVTSGEGIDILIVHRRSLIKIKYSLVYYQQKYPDPELNPESDPCFYDADCRSRIWIRINMTQSSTHIHNVLCSDVFYIKTREMKRNEREICGGNI